MEYFPKDVLVHYIFTEKNLKGYLIICRNVCRRFRQLVKPGEKIDPNIFAMNEHLNLLIWLIEQDLGLSMMAVEYIARLGRLDLVQRMNPKKFKGSQTDIYFHITRAAIVGGKIHIIEWNLKKQVPNQVCHGCLAVAHNQFEVLKWLGNNGCLITTNTLNEAIKHNRTKMITWIRNRSIDFDDNSIIQAIKAGNLDLLKEIHKNARQYADNYLYFYDAAIEGGHINILEFIKEKYPNDIYQYNTKWFKRDRFYVFGWFIDHMDGLDWNTIYIYCFIHNRIDVLQFIYYRKGELPYFTMSENMISSASHELINWLQEKGYGQSMETN